MSMNRTPGDDVVVRVRMRRVNAKMWQEKGLVIRPFQPLPARIRLVPTQPDEDGTPVFAIEMTGAPAMVVGNPELVDTEIVDNDLGESN